MKHILILFNLTFYSFLYGQNDTIKKFNRGVFPVQWDSNMNLRSGNEQVLAWIHKADDRPYEVKSCILLRVSTDSLGQKIYEFSQKYSNQKPFNVWNYSSIHFAPGPGQEMGFYDLHLKRFDHVPTENEIYTLLKSWNFTIQEDSWRIIESGLDEKLWLLMFGFLPIQSF